MTDGTTLNDVNTTYSLADLMRVMARLRDPGDGCPWDLQQDFRSIVPSTIEECYELADAIERDDLPHIAEELGDVLFQVIFYSQLGSEQGAFDFHTVVDTLVRKLIRRHPHVFADGAIEGRLDGTVSAAEVKANWEAIKREERAGKARHGVLDDIPVTLPALQRAQKLQKRAATIGFDWSALESVLANLTSEIDELRDALARANDGHISDEFGDVLFSVVNLGRHLGLDAETALRHANTKFETRFTAMERAALEDGTELALESIDRLQERWERVKSSE